MATTNKYNVGDKVRIISKRGNRWNSSGKMDKYCGTVMTIRKSDGYLHFMEEDKHENCGMGWCWSDDDIVEVVKDETPKYKIGDRVIVDESNIEGIVHFKGKDLEGIITRISSNPESTHPYMVSTELNPMGIFCSVKGLAPEKKEAEEKIVITHDGKTTTATLYRVDGTVEIATARCAPEDTFNFTVGAKIAMERLEEKVNPVKAEEAAEDVEWRVVNRKPKVGDYIRLVRTPFSFDTAGDILKVGEVDRELTLVYEHDLPNGKRPEAPDYKWAYLKSDYEVVEKVNPINIDGFKVGDRVNYNGVNGTVICLAATGTPSIGVEFDKQINLYTHDCEGIPLIAGTIGAKGLSRWMYSHEIAHGEVYDNKPLTTEELKEMDGKEVYVSGLDENLKESFDDSWGIFEFSGWHKVNVKENKVEGKTGYYDIRDNGVPNGFRAYRKEPTEAIKTSK